MALCEHVMAGGDLPWTAGEMNANARRTVISGSGPGCTTGFDRSAVVPPRWRSAAGPSHESTREGLLVRTRRAGAEE